MEIGINHFLVVSAILFTLGVFGIFLNRRNVIIILMSIELMLLSVQVNMVTFSVYLQDLTGQAFVELKNAEEGTLIYLFQSASDKPGKAPAELRPGDRAILATPAVVVSRFPK